MGRKPYRELDGLSKQDANEMVGMVRSMVAGLNSANDALVRRRMRPDGFLPEDMPLVNEALRRAKAPLTVLRQKHGVTGDVEYRLRYNTLGEIVAATVDKAPLGLTAEFIDGAITIIRGTVVFPRTLDGGVMNFVDLGPARSANAALINAAQDLEREAQKEREATQTMKTVMIVILAVLALSLVMLAKVLISR